MMKRREFLSTASAAGLGTLAAPTLLRAQGAPLKVGTYGGYFEESFKEHVFPDVTAATGVAVAAIPDHTAAPWLVPLHHPARTAALRGP